MAIHMYICQLYQFLGFHIKIELDYLQLYSVLFFERKNVYVVTSVGLFGRRIEELIFNLMQNYILKTSYLNLKKCVKKEILS